MRNVWVATLMVATSLFVSVALAPGVARACSCASPVSTANLLGSGKRAFVGIPVERRMPPDPPEGFLRVVYEVEVVDAIKGTIPATVEVFTGEGGGDCGISLPLDVEVGLIPYTSNGVDSVGSCGGVVDPGELRDLRDAALPAPTGSGAVAAFVLARAGPAGVIAVDAQFRPLGYVAADNDYISVAACPGEKRAIALAIGDGEAFVDVIDVASLSRAERRVLDESMNPNGPPQWWYFSSISCANEEGDALLFTAALTGPETTVPTIRSLTADGVSAPMELPDVIDVAVRDGIVYALSIDALTTRSPDDGSVTSTVASFDDGVDAAAFTLDDVSAVVAIGPPEGAFDRAADLLLLIPLNGGPTTTITLERPVPGPMLTDAANGFVVRSSFDRATTWFGSDGIVLADGTDSLWPAGDGYLTWTSSPDRFESHLGDTTSTVLEFASYPRSVLAFTDGPLVAPDAPGARAIRLVEAPGSIEGVSLTTAEETTVSAASTNLAPTTSAPASESSEPPTTTPASPTVTTNDDSGGSSGWAIGIGIAVITVAVALGGWQTRRIQRRSNTASL